MADLSFFTVLWTLSVAKKCSFISHSGILQLWLDISFHVYIYIHVALIFLSTHAHNFSRVKSLGRSIIFCSTLDTFFSQEMQFHVSLWSDTFCSYSFFIEFTLFKYMVTHKALNMFLSYSLNAYAILRK